MHDETRSNNKINELFVSDETYESLDDCLAKAEKTSNLFSVIRDIIQSQQKPQKRPKIRDLKPIVHVRFNTRVSDKTKQVSLKCLLDSGASSSLIAAKHAKDLHKENSTGHHTPLLGI